MALVRVSFKSTSDTRYVATRRLQLTVKKNTRSQKTLDGSLQILRDGEKTSISTRVAELDQLIPQYLGVSKAVLESVIFCHQEDSLWPMSEPAKLKARFDEIFEALKYTKAIENITRIRKVKNEELGRLKLVEKHAKEDKERGEKCEARCNQLVDEIETLKEKAKELEQRMEEAQAKSEEAFNHASRFEQIVAQLHGKRITYQANQESVAELEDNIKRMAESDEELQSMLDQYEERVALYESQQEELREQYSQLKRDLDNNRGALGRKQGDIGKFEAEKEQHDRQLQKRETLIKEAAKRHGVRGFDYDIGDEKVAEFMNTIGRMSREQDRAVNKARQEAEDELRKAQAAINQLNDRKSSLTQRKETSKSQITANEKRVTDLQRTMDRISVDEGAEAALQEKRNDTERRLQAAVLEADAQKYDQRIHEADFKVRQLDERKEHLDAEMVEATKLSRETAQIEYARDELKSAKHGFETMKGVHGARIAKLIDPEWEVVTLESTYQRVASQKATAVKEAESRREVDQASLDKVNFKMSTLEAEQRQKRAQLAESERAVLKVIGTEDISDFERTLQALEEDYDQTQGDATAVEAMVEYMNLCIKTAKEHKQCRTCRRNLEPDEAPNGLTISDFVTLCKKTIANQQSKLEAQESNVDEAHDKLVAARKARPQYETALHLRNTELPRLKSELAQTLSERDSLVKQLEEHDDIIDELRSSKQEVESISKDVHSLVNYHNQVQGLEMKIHDLSEKLKTAGSSRGIDAISEDLKEVTEETRVARVSLTRLSADREKLRNNITSLELKFRDINAELNSAQSKLKEKRDLLDRIEDYKSQNTEQRESIRSVDGDLQKLMPRIEQAQAKYDDIKRRGNEQIQRLQQDATKLSDSVRQLSEVEQDIQAYIDKGGPSQLSRAQRDIESLEHEIQEIDKDMLQVTRKLKKIEDTVRDTETTKRCISDNLRYRRASRALQGLQAEIEELESHNAEADKQRYEVEGSRWHNMCKELSMEQATLHGTIKTKDNTVGELLAEWQTDYKDAAYKYREAHIKVETTKAAVEDLGRYGGALDKAIMKYHTLKMDEINRIIEELWKNAYQGTDVDLIRIRSDNETGKGNRNYNYRVVMVKQDVEMDMRGRCSAGQKVLASIVIRLALAECFGVNCGLIALDEPTTNLDQQNIEGLAVSLSEIIKIRRKQANFQLIVITHDEEFLRAMKCADYTDVYWRVGRNEEQCSVIERQNIADVNKG